MEEKQLAQEKQTEQTARWYVLHSYAGQEKKAIQLFEEQLKLRNLSHLVKEIFVPTEEVTIKKGKVQKTKLVSHFPGYILMHMILTDQLWHVLKDNSRISGFIGNSQKQPQSISDKELNAIKDRIKQGMKQSQIDSTFQVGQMVSITDGPFMDFKGVVHLVDAENAKITVTVSIFGRSTPIELELDKVKLITEE